jgi:hypothetical protein
MYEESNILVSFVRRIDNIREVTPVNIVKQIYAHLSAQLGPSLLTTSSHSRAASGIGAGLCFDGREGQSFRMSFIEHHL